MEIIQTTKPNARYVIFSVYDSEKNTLTPCKDKMDALYLIKDKTGKQPELKVPYKTYEYIVWDKRKKRNYDTDKIFVFTGHCEDSSLFHFIPLQTDKELADKIPPSEIKQIADGLSLPIIGTDEEIESDFQIITTFFKRAVGTTKTNAYRFYPMSEIVQLIAIFRMMHCSQQRKHMNRNLITVAAHRLGINYRLKDKNGKLKLSQDDEYTQVPVREGFYLPRVLPATVVAYTLEKDFSSERWAQKRGRQKNRKTRLSQGKKAIEKRMSDIDMYKGMYELGIITATELEERLFELGEVSE